ncbi:MAG: hypothetical protein Q8M07_22625 [Prosthecobacter sp.]|nr:hypothetical protein [Prosthecobacter sp.]
MARAKTKIKAKAKIAKKAIRAKIKKSVRRVASKTAPPRRRAAKSSLVKDLGVLADKISSMGKSMFEQGTEKASELARAGVGAVERGSEKISGEIASIKRAAFSRMKS